MRNLQTNEVSEVFELEYLAPDETGETRWTQLDNPEMPNEFLQQFITHTSNRLDVLQRKDTRFTGATDLVTGKFFFADVESHLEQALELMWQELGRRANGIQT